MPTIRCDERSTLRVQLDVIGALLVREIHTRFGRDNVGYLWLLIEPMMLTSAVAAMHAYSGNEKMMTYDLAPFWATGYTPFIMWRGIVGRSESALESNRSLLYHRYITVLDILVARSVLEFVAVTATMFIILGLCAACEAGTLPQRPLLMFCGLLLLLWFSFATGACVAAACERKPVVGRLVHPLIYLSLPVSGAFYAMSWMPPGLQRVLGWVPTTHIFELIRMGEFAEYPDKFVDPSYVVAWCMALTFIGLLSLRIVRRHMHSE